MPKGKTPSAAKALASMVRSYHRLERSLGEAKGVDPELAELLERKAQVAAELRDLRHKLKLTRGHGPRAAVPDDPTLASLRDSILLMSRNLGIDVHLD